MTLHLILEIFIFEKKSLIKKKGYFGASGEMAQWLKVLATKPEDLSLSPQTCTVEGENNCLRLSIDPHTYPSIYTISKK